MGRGESVTSSHFRLPSERENGHMKQLLASISNKRKQLCPDSWWIQQDNATIQIYFWMYVHHLPPARKFRPSNLNLGRHGCNKPTHPSRNPDFFKIQKHVFAKHLKPTTRKARIRILCESAARLRGQCVGGKTIRQQAHVSN